MAQSTARVQRLQELASSLAFNFEYLPAARFALYDKCFRVGMQSTLAV
jgi:hypothetical protein